MFGWQQAYKVPKQQLQVIQLIARLIGQVALI
ncbi:hypothetical protein OPIT5_16525 [Opitutaceae bacterium TAV5]|nr:hypothetical protein OPIT5_16525 [Opitutaceae bacterium TAV5]